MGTRADRHSIAASSRALVDAIVASGAALALLVLALLTAPIRLIRGRSQPHARPAPIKHIQVEVHLDLVDAKLGDEEPWYAVLAGEHMRLDFQSIMCGKLGRRVTRTMVSGK